MYTKPPVGGYTTHFKSPAIFYFCPIKTGNVFVFLNYNRLTDKRKRYTSPGNVQRLTWINLGAFQDSEDLLDH